VLQSTHIWPMSFFRATWPLRFGLISYCFSIGEGADAQLREAVNLQFASEGDDSSVEGRWRRISAIVAGKFILCIAAYLLISD